jgi:hypothetical protein
LPAVFIPGIAAGIQNGMQIRKYLEPFLGCCIHYHRFAVNHPSGSRDMPS